ncbi:uncharacterized protein LOC144447752 [Glandiceps talaboti]
MKQCQPSQVTAKETNHGHKQELPGRIGMGNIRKYAISVLVFLYFINVALFLGFHYRTWTKGVLSKYDVRTSLCGLQNNNCTNNTNTNFTTPFNETMEVDLTGNLSENDRNLIYANSAVHGEDKQLINNHSINGVLGIIKVNAPTERSPSPNVAFKAGEIITNDSVHFEVPEKNLLSRGPNYNPVVRINLNDFTFIMNPRNICNDQNLFLVTLVTTKHDHVWRRQTIRSTWASVKQVDDKKIATLFIFGKSNSSEMWTVLKEFRSFQDIMLSDFDENYLNLTLKTLMGLK